MLNRVMFGFMSRKRKRRTGRRVGPRHVCSSCRRQLFLHPFSFCTGISGTVTNPNSTMYEMKIGALTFQVAVGDITEESVDVIVNSTTRMFNLKSGTSFK